MTRLQQPNRPTVGPTLAGALVLAALAAAGCRGTEPERPYRLGSVYELAAIDGKPLPYDPPHPDRGRYDRTVSARITILSDSELVYSTVMQDVYQFSPTDIQTLPPEQLDGGFTYARRGNTLDLTSWPESQVREHFSLAVRHGALVQVTSGAHPHRLVFRGEP